MTVTTPPTAFSDKEKSSLQARFGRRRSMECSVPDPTDGMPATNAESCFSEEEAASLVEELLACVGYPAEYRHRDFLVSLLRAMPKMHGAVLEVVDALRELLLLTIGERTDSGKERQEQAEAAYRILELAEALRRKPSLAAWYDIKAFLNEKERLNALPDKERSDAERDFLRFLVKIEQSGPLRDSCAVPDPAALMKLMQKFPNFDEPLRFLAEQAAFARLRGGSSFHFIPILLTGPAGVGKTHFALALAEVLSAHTEVVSMASQSCGFAISGMDRGWSSARPGMVFEALHHGKSLSPLIVLDEIDKANQEGRSDPLGPLYTLLEQRVSRSFRDEYVGLPVNDSQVFWVATANDKSRIPGPLLSRFKVFEISGPNAGQVSAIAEQVFEEIAAGIPGTPYQLPESWHQKLEGHSVREIRIALQQALGRAALRAVMSKQAAVDLNEQDLSLSSSNGTKRIGF